MFITLKKSLNVIALPLNPLVLEKVDDSRLTFSVYYTYNRDVGVVNNVNKINIEISQIKNKISTTSIVRDSQSILLDSAVQSDAIQQKNEEVLAKTSSDPTAYLNNEAIVFLNRGIEPSQLNQLQTKVLRVGSTAAPIVGVVAQHDVGDRNNDERALAESMLRGGVDPTSSYSVNELGLSPSESYEGTHKQSPVNFTTNLQQNLYKYKNNKYFKSLAVNAPGQPGVVISNSERTDKRVVPTNERTTNIEIKSQVSFELSQSDTEHYYLTLKALTSSGDVVQTISLNFNPQNFVTVHAVPIRAPVVSLGTKTNALGSVLSIIQVDENAKTVRVYARKYSSNQGTKEPYSTIGEFDAPTNKRILVPVNVSSKDPLIFRIVPVGKNGAVGSTYGSTVSNLSNKNNFDHTTIVANSELNGVRLEVFELPSDCVAFAIEKRDLTLKSNSILMQTVVLVDQQANKNYEFVDLDAKNTHTYSYTCIFYKKNGSTTRRLACVHTYETLSIGLVEVKLNNLTTTKDGDVKFEINTKISNSNVDQYKFLLQKQDLYDLFKDDVLEARDQLTQLIAHNIVRVDLQSGEVEDFGIITENSFSDRELRVSRGVSELKAGRRYRYSVTTLLRYPETMLETFVKNVVDQTSNREYSYRPFKFLHPIVSSHGNIVSGASLQKNHAQDSMSFGRVGNNVSVEISTENKPSNITNLTAETFERDKIILKWKDSGTTSSIDHYRVTVLDGDGNHVVGHLQAIPNVSSYTWIGKQDRYRKGLNLKYSVTPVSLEFVSGTETTIELVTSQEAGR